MPADGDGAGVEVSKPVKALMKNQRRLRGVVSSVGSDGRCYVHCEYGVFPFERKSVKENKNHPTRPPHVGDTCEFRLTHQMPPSAVSVRIQVPKALDPETMKVCYTLLDNSCGAMSVLVFQLDAAELRHSLCCLTLCNQALDALVENAPQDVGAFPSLLSNEAADAAVAERVQYALRNPCDRTLHMQLPSVYQFLTCLPPKFSAIIVEQVATRVRRIAADVRAAPKTLAEYTAHASAVGGAQYAAVSHVVAAHLSADLDHAAADAVGTLIFKVQNLRTPPGTPSALPLPQEAWAPYARDLAALAASKDALACLHALVLDALDCVPTALGYLGTLGSVDLPCFRFVGIPFLLAFATLAAAWGADACFSRGVSVGRAAGRAMMKIRTVPEAADAVAQSLARLRAAAKPALPHADRLTASLAAIDDALARFLKPPGET
eukprot:TRINITY_DN21465_c0_g1_i1.p1 TRINITY_DN21465_c0_g1~~TRINITY_DN21465_c0_g1_i1.p1  ORF type:complete len:435 (+),score=132.34 TRINITY_DN21465_c0_g1_i1:56-1360(+)